MAINTGTATPRLDLLGPILQEGFAEETYVAQKVLPPLLVQKVSGAIPSFLFTNNQILNIKHADKASFTRQISQLGQATYNCQEAGLEEPISFRDLEIMGDRVWPIITRKLVHNVLRARDSALATALFSATGETTFAANLVTAALPWTNAGGTPLDDIFDAKAKVQLACGVPANRMLISYQCYVNICKNAQVRTAYRANFGVGFDQGMDAAILEIPVKSLAALFGVQEIIIGGGVYNTKPEGQTAVNAYVWPATYCLLYVGSAGQQDAVEVALGRMFVYELATEVPDLVTIEAADMLKSMFVEQYPEAQTNSTVLRAREHIDMQVYYASAGSLIKSV